MKAEWRSVLTTSGVLCVMTPGEMLMLLSCVDSCNTQLKVRQLGKVGNKDTAYIVYKYFSNTGTLVKLIYTSNSLRVHNHYTHFTEYQTFLH